MMRSFRINLDSLGMFTSALCMVHCLAFPLLLAVLPMWRLSTAGEDGNTQAQVVSSNLVSSNSGAATQAHSHDDCCEDECCESEEGGTGNGTQTALCCSTPTDFWVHVGLLAAVAPLGIVAWGAGYYKHRRMGVLALGLVGVLLLSGALLFGHQLLAGRGEQVMTVLGSICMVSAHLWNRRQCKCCRTADASQLVEIESAPSEPQQIPITNGGVS